MALPVNVSTVTVTGTYVDLQGVPVKGNVNFTPRTNLINSSAAVTLVASTITATLDNNGHFSVVLPITDDPDLNPIGFSYLVQESFTGGRTFDILIPQGGAPVIDIADLAAALTEAAIGGYITQAQANGVYVRYVSADDALYAFGDAAIQANAATAYSTLAVGYANDVVDAPSPFLTMGM